MVACLLFLAGLIVARTSIVRHARLRSHQLTSFVSLQSTGKAVVHWSQAARVRRHDSKRPRPAGVLQDPRAPAAFSKLCQTNQAYLPEPFRTPLGSRTARRAAHLARRFLR